MTTHVHSGAVLGTDVDLLTVEANLAACRFNKVAAKSTTDSAKTTPLAFLHNPMGDLQ